MTTAEIDSIKLESNCFGSSDALELAKPMTEQKMAIHAAHFIFIIRPQMAKIIPNKFLGQKETKFAMNNSDTYHLAHLWSYVNKF